MKISSYIKQVTTQNLQDMIEVSPERMKALDDQMFKPAQEAINKIEHILETSKTTKDIISGLGDLSHAFSCSVQFVAWLLKDVEVVGVNELLYVVLSGESAYNMIMNKLPNYMRDSLAIAHLGADGAGGFSKDALIKNVEESNAGKDVTLVCDLSNKTDQRYYDEVSIGAIESALPKEVYENLINNMVARSLDICVISLNKAQCLIFKAPKVAFDYNDERYVVYCQGSGYMICLNAKDLALPLMREEECVNVKFNGTIIYGDQGLILNQD